MITRLALAAFASLAAIGCSAQNSETKSLVAEASMSNVAAPALASVSSVTARGAGKAADFSWTADGKKQSFAELTKGKVTLLNFWATWCPPCRKEIPDIVALTKELPANKFVVVGISLDTKGDPATEVAKFTQKNSMGYLNLIGNGEIVEAYGDITSIPTTFIIDANGNVVDQIVGSRSKEQFMESIKKAMK